MFGIPISFLSAFVVPLSCPSEMRSEAQSRVTDKHLNLRMVRDAIKSFRELPERPPAPPPALPRAHMCRDAAVAIKLVPSPT